MTEGFRQYVSEAAFAEDVQRAAGLPITPRDLFAAAALAGLLTHNAPAIGPGGECFGQEPFTHLPAEIQARDAFALADAMMVERAKAKP